MGIKMLLKTAFALLTLLLPIHSASLPSSYAADKPLPLIIWHGLGDSFEGEGMIEVAELAEAINPGTYTYLIRMADDASSDRSASFWGNVTEQIQQLCDDISNDPILSAAPAIDALGFSQGGVFLRGYVERCNQPPVRSLVTFGSPHNGIADFTGCRPTDWVCRGAMGLLKSNTWGSYVQGRLVPAQYYRTTDNETGGPTEEYLTYSNYLADVNNEREIKSTVYAEKLASLEKFVMYLFEDDVTVIPKESSWFAEVNTDTGEVTPLKNRTLYKSDWLGLQKLDKKGGLIFKTTPGGHMRLSDEVLNNTFKTYYGPASRTKSMTIEEVNLEL
jgi:palmitoyl-protein thioesterase